MSRICSYCSLKEIKSRAEKKNNKVSIIPTYNPEIQTEDMNGVNVYVHPKNINIKNENRKTYLKSWLMSLPDKCVC